MFSLPLSLDLKPVLNLNQNLRKSGTDLFTLKKTISKKSDFKFFLHDFWNDDIGKFSNMVMKWIRFG